jgi:phosphatidylserine decarboxylase precursor
MADQPIVTELKKLLNKHKKEAWEKLLLDSITEAKTIAVREKVERAKGWPEGLEGEHGYYEYLNKMVRWIPRENYPQQVYYMLCEFYWMLDQPPGRELQKSEEFNTWMRHFANDWGSFLNTPESAKYIQTFIDDPAFNAWQYMKPPSGWLTFNQFFGREISPGLRPVAGMRCDSIVTSPADSTFKAQFDIDDTNEITLKHTHKYKIADLLEGSPYKDKFRDGLFWHAFLGPNDYHRFGAPVRGPVLECRAIQQNVYLQVTLQHGKLHGQLAAPDEAGYQFTQTRGLIIQDSPVGLVACLPIGMAQVSSVNMTAVKGAFLEKGQEFGYFLFGGSDIILLFEKGKVEMTAAPGIHYNVGMCVGEALKML